MSAIAVALTVSVPTTGLSLWSNVDLYIKIKFQGFFRVCRYFCVPFLTLYAVFVVVFVVIYCCRRLRQVHLQHNDHVNFWWG